ncbi:MAG: hypothetical protein H6832_03225 [Planctomycetes bacterium]|nr:hypothetical protein [Planctomycetota bacterium]
MCKSNLNPNAKPFVPGAGVNALEPGPQPVVVPQPQVEPPAPVVAAPEQDPPADENSVIAYANNFADKHTREHIETSTAVVVGRSRGPKVQFSTVFRKAYLEHQVLDNARGKATGNYSLSIACHSLGAGDFALAGRNNKGNWIAMKNPMFFCKVCYRVTSPAGQRTVTLTHIETDF